jgi:hypothetical protein
VNAASCQVFYRAINFRNIRNPNFCLRTLFACFRRSILIVSYDYCGAGGHKRSLISRLGLKNVALKKCKNSMLKVQRIEFPSYRFRSSLVCLLHVCF